MKKFLKYSGIGIAVLFLFLLIAPFIFKQKLIDASKAFINEQLVADVDFDEKQVSLSFIRNFPNVSFSIGDISVIGRDSFEADTIAFLPKLKSTFNIKSVFGDEIKVKSIVLEEPKINIEVLRDGTPNWEIWRTDSITIDTTETTFALGLEEIGIENGNISYKDYSLGFFTSASNLNYAANGDFTQDEFTLINDLKAESLQLEYGGIPWLSNAVVSTKANLKMNIPAFKVGWDSDDIQVNDLKIHSDGFVQINENDMDMDFRFNALENRFKSFLSMVPGIYQNQFNNLKAEGKMSLTGSMKGKMTETLMPKTEIHLNINNGYFSYPDLPRDVKNVFVDLSYTNPNGLPDNTVIDVSKLKADVGGDKIEGYLLYKTPVSNPYIDTKLKGKIDLKHLKHLVPLEKGSVLEGLIDTDIMAKGHVESAQNNFADLEAKGFLKCKGVEYSSPENPNGTALKTVDIEISPKYATIENAVGHLGRNDFKLDGKVENYLAYVFAGETLKGNLDLRSNYLNANDFMSEDEVSSVDPKPSDSANLSIVVLPENIDWKMSADVKKLIYDNFVLENVVGNLHLANAAIEFDGVSASLAGGTVGLDGVYDSKNIKNPFTQLSTNLSKFDIKKSFEYFPFLNRFTNLANVVNGIFDAKVEMSSILDQNMQPNYNSMNVEAELNISNAVVQNFDVLQQIGGLLKLDWLKNMKLQDKSLKLRINEGVLSMLDSLQVNLGRGATMKLSGSSRLSKAINYGGRLEIPRELFGKANDVLNSWKDLAAAKNWNLDVAKNIPVDLSIAGTFIKPDVKVSLHSIKNSVLDPLKKQIVDKAKDEGNKKITEYLDQAQKQADKIKAEAKKRADQIRQAGKNTADSIRNETTKKADKLREEAKVRAYNLKQEGEARKKEIMAKADKEVDNLVKQAEGKGPIAELAAKKAGEKVKEKALIEANKVQKEYDNKVDAANNKADENITSVQNEGNRKAQQIENEANEKADRLEREAQDRADKIMQEARDKSKL